MTRPTQPGEILPHDLPRALDHAAETISVLSLDCFDTLLWRDMHMPADVFSALPGLAPQQRMHGETMARRAMRVRRQRSEVSLADIYRAALPALGPADRGAERMAAIAAELAAEARACFAFAPTVALMREARARGLKVIIVSDTYLSAAELAALIQASAGEEVLALIDRVFVSSEAGISKSEGLLAKALTAMKVRAHQVLHVGDNPRADFEAARALGIPALHLVQFGEEMRQQLRLERACAQFDADRASGNGQFVGFQPHRALLAHGEPALEDPAQRLGYCVLGPVFAAFERWLRSEAQTLEKAHGGRVHWLFMLRDGYLPHLVHEAFNAARQTASRAAPPSAARIEISRFTANAASFVERDAYEDHVAVEYALNPATLARQMLFTQTEIAQVVGDPQGAAALSAASLRLHDELRSGKRQKTTMRRARELADRLVTHVRAQLSIEPGDVLMLVDLGYNGSAQNGIDALLQEALGVHVAGRYLLCRETRASGLDKRGLIDLAHFSPGLLEALCGNVAVIEQLATCALGSVIGYEDDGTPIRKDSELKGSQSDVRDAVQAGVVRFARDFCAPPIVRVRESDANAAWREAAAAILARFLFLPQRAELAVIKSFEHDVNLGSERMVALFDPAQAREGLRRRGLFYMKGSPRMFLPAELAQEDMSTRLSLMVQKRFGLGLTYDDYAPRRLTLSALYLGASGAAQTRIEAHPTHDGFYAARLPVPEHGEAVALQLGEALRWVEIASVTCSPLASLKASEASDATPMPVAVEFDGVEERAPGLYECSGPQALLMVRTGAMASRGGAALMIEVVLRPVGSADTAALAPSSPAALSPREAAA